MTRFVALAALTTLLACSNPKEEPSREPAHHRATPSACPPAPPEQSYQDTFRQQPCYADTDCKGGGRCRGEAQLQGTAGQSFENVCVYDECTDDTGCPPTSLCDCRNASHRGTNICVAAACKRDSDCGSTGFCSASARLWVSTIIGMPNPRPDGIEYGYFCHTAADECSSDADCNDGGPGSARDYDHCAFDSKVAHWRCAGFNAAVE